MYDTRETPRKGRSWLVCSTCVETPEHHTDSVRCDVTGDPERWIVIPRWHAEDGFQHYHDRDPIWIKNYRFLLADDDYLKLTAGERAILHGLWLVYASSDGQVRFEPSSLSRRLSLRVRSCHLEALNHAGFIQVVASKPLALRYQVASPEKETEGEKQDQNPKAVLIARNAANGHHDDPTHIRETIAESLAAAANRPNGLGDE